MLDHVVPVYTTPRRSKGVCSFVEATVVYIPYITETAGLISISVHSKDEYKYMEQAIVCIFIYLPLCMHACMVNVID